MTDKRHFHAAAQWHVDEITARIVAESGIPSDRFHMGKIILQSLKDDPGLVGQIDGATRESETNDSLLKRSIQCAIGFRKLGLQRGDVILCMAPNHLDLVVPFYAALFEGIAFAPRDKDLGIAELKDTFKTDVPKVIFCQNGKVPDIQEALNRADVIAKVITFDTNSNGGDTFTKLLNLGNDANEIQEYKAVNIDPEEDLALLVPTSGTTGLPKSAAVTHKNLAVMGPYIWARATEIPYIKRSLLVSPLQWLTGIINFINAPIMKFTRIQTSSPTTQKHIYHLINTYKPEYMILSPTMMAALLNPKDRDACDFTCFKSIVMGGSAVQDDLILEIRVVSPQTEAVTMYGMTELTGAVFQHGHSSPHESCGKPLSCLQYRLIDPETGADINEPNKNGELWLKGPGVFKGYYNNPEATKEIFAEDGWLKSGDLLYRDESWNFYFVDRIKLLLKYKNHQISPVELETVIVQHPGVIDVAVTAIPDKECGDLPVACVVKVPGYNVTAQEIKNLVKENLTDTKQLRGGVVFVDQLPITASTKLHRRKIKEMVLNMKRE